MRLSHRRLLCALVVLVGATGASPQEWLAVGDEWVVNEATAFTQEWARVATDADGELFGFTWKTGLENDVKTRLMDADGSPLTSESFCNANTLAGIQDEAAICMDGRGNAFVAWSDRAGNDGFQMGIFGRLYDFLGAPRGPEFQINVEWQESQWEPLIASMPNGNWVVAWSGRDNGDAFFRIFNPLGVPLTGDIQVNTFTGNAQIDTAPAIGPDGTIFMTFVDFSGQGAGSGTAIFGRLYDKDGVPLQAEEFILHETYVEGDQREPRVAADALGRFVVVWEDRLADGSGDAVVARRFDSSGTPLGPEFIVNEVTSSHQNQPALAVDWVGNFIVAWTDASAGFDRVVARRFDADGVPLDGEFLVRDSAVSHVRLPSIAMDRAGEDIVIAYHGRPTEGSANPDILARRYEFRPITEGTPPTLGTTFELDLHLPGGAGLYYILVGSFATSPVLDLPDGRTFRQAPDALFEFSLFGGDMPPFDAFQGVLDGEARATASLDLPFDPAFVGVTLYFGAVTVDLGQIELVDQLRHVTDPRPVLLQ